METISYYHHYVLSPEIILWMLLLKFLNFLYFSFSVHDSRFYEFSCVPCFIGTFHVVVRGSLERASYSVSSIHKTFFVPVSMQRKSGNFLRRCQGRENVRNKFEFMVFRQKIQKILILKFNDFFIIKF